MVQGILFTPEEELAIHSRISTVPAASALHSSSDILERSAVRLMF
jgi:hypothetical protein